jgi:hypothetical protein
MSIPLAEALRQVELEAGRTYRCRVHELLVEVRVLDREPEAPGLPESDVMLDAWVELPQPPGGKVLVSRPGVPDLPDVPDIPRDEETA